MRWMILAFDMTPENGAVIAAFVGIGIFVWYILPAKAKEFISALWNAWVNSKKK